MRAIAVALLLLLSGCASSKPLQSHPSSDTTIPATDLPTVFKELHVNSTRAHEEIGFRLSFQLTASGRCDAFFVAHWIIAPDDARPYFFAMVDGEAVRFAGPKVIRTTAHAHATAVDTRDVVPAPWFNLYPEQDLEGHYDFTFSLGLGGHFAYGPINITLVGRDLVPGASGRSFGFDLACDAPFVVHALESARDIHLFDMLSLENGTGASLGNDMSRNEGDELRATLSGGRVRLVAEDSDGTGSIRFDPPMGTATWTLTTWVRHQGKRPGGRSRSGSGSKCCSYRSRTRSCRSQAGIPHPARREGNAWY